ncbi:hypothetical protein T4E_10785, partial [Trichinella pseudospiralis]
LRDRGQDQRSASDDPHFFIGRELSSLPDRDNQGRPVRGDSRSLTLLHRRCTKGRWWSTSGLAGSESTW